MKTWRILSKGMTIQGKRTKKRILIAVTSWLVAWMMGFGMLAEAGPIVPVMGRLNGGPLQDLGDQGVFLVDSDTYFSSLLGDNKIVGSELFGTDTVIFNATSSSSTLSPYTIRSSLSVGDDIRPGFGCPEPDNTCSYAIGAGNTRYFLNSAGGLIQPNQITLTTPDSPPQSFSAGSTPFDLFIFEDAGFSAGTFTLRFTTGSGPEITVSLSTASPFTDESGRGLDAALAIDLDLLAQSIGPILGGIRSIKIKDDNDPGVIGSSEGDRAIEIDFIAGSYGAPPSPTISTPEPATLLLVSSGIVGLAAWRSRRRRSRTDE